MWTLRVGRFLTLVGVVCSVGCGGERTPGAVSASGIVMHQGKPVAEAQVTFAPISGSGRAAYASTDAVGRFTLGVEGHGDGAFPGEYFVSIVKNIVDGPVLTSEQEVLKYKQEHDGNLPNVKPSDEVPAKYANPKSSGLTATVTDNGPNEFVFDLK